VPDGPNKFSHQRVCSQSFQPWQDDFLIFKLNVKSHFKSLHICDGLSCCHSKQLIWTVSDRIADDIGNKNNKLCLQETEYDVMNMLCPSLVCLDVHCNLGHFMPFLYVIPNHSKARQLRTIIPRTCKLMPAARKMENRTVQVPWNQVWLNKLRGL